MLKRTLVEYHINTFKDYSLKRNDRKCFVQVLLIKKKKRKQQQNKIKYPQVAQSRQLADIHLSDINQILLVHEAFD